jgi:hypothetical protein
VSSTSHNPTGLHGLLRGQLYFLYVDDIHISQETHIWASKLCHGDSFTFYIEMMFIFHRKHIYGPPNSVTGIALLFI